MSMGALYIVIFNPTRFALYFTLGNMVSIVGYVIVRYNSTGFLVGFRNQCTSMWKKERRITTFVFYGSMVMILVSIYELKSKLLVLIFLIVEICAYVWYTASYLPYVQ
jgi:hypothetical protein